MMIMAGMRMMIMHAAHSIMAGMMMMMIIIIIITTRHTPAFFIRGNFLSCTLPSV